MSVDVERKQVLAYRIAAHGLDRATSSPADLAVFALGIQDTPGRVRTAGDRSTSARRGRG